MSTRDKKRNIVFQQKVLSKLQLGSVPSRSVIGDVATSVEQNEDIDGKKEEISGETSTEDKTVPEKRVKIYIVCAKPSSSDDDVTTSETKESELANKPQTEKNRKRKLKKKRQKKAKRKEIVSSISFTYNPTTPTN